MRGFHSEHYPKLKRALRNIGQGLSTPDFKIAVYTLTKAEETKFGSVYAFQMKISSPDHVSEEEVDRYIDEKDWRKIIAEKLCEYYPDAKEVENGVRIPEIAGTLEIPDAITFKKYE